METILIPLSKLRIDPANVRHPKEGDLAAQVHDMQASLLELGQLSALEVRPLRKPRGHYQVFAGGRRLLAFQGLVEDGRIDAGHLVRCDVHDVDDARATEISAAENLIRVALKPTEEFQLFAELLEQGVPEDDIARRFGIEVNHVRQRGRLGRLHPDIFAALDAEDISLDLAKAYAATTDQALQIRVFTEMRAGWQHYPHNVRNAIRGGAAAINADKMLEVVGAAAYTAAGGQLEEDLFTHHQRVLQLGTLSELYYAKLAEQEAALKARLPEQVVEVVTSAVDLGRPVFAGSELADDEKDRLLAIDARADVIHEMLEQLAEPQPADASGAEPLVADRPEDQAIVDTLRAELAQLEDEGEAIHAGAQPALPDGPVVAWAEPGENGMTIRGYYRPRGYVEPGTAAAGVGAAGDAPAASLDLPIGLDPRVGFGDRKPAVKAEFGLTQDAIEVMRSHRRAILRGMMLDRAEPYAARIGGLLLPFMVLRLTLQAPGRRGVSAAAIGAAGGFHTAGHPAGAEDVARQPCSLEWKKRVEELQAQDWMTEPDLRAAYGMFVELDDREQERASAIAAGLLLERSLQAPGYRVPLHDELAVLIGVADGAAIRQRYWSPDAAFFDQLPKSRKIAAVGEVNGAIARQIGKLPNAEISAACALFFSGSDEARRRFTMMPGTLAHAKRWIPPFLAFDDEPRGPRLAETHADRGVHA